VHVRFAASGHSRTAHSANGRFARQKPNLSEMWLLTRTSFCSSTQVALDRKRAASTPNWLSAAGNGTLRCNYEIPITLLARASRKHMRLEAALTEKMRRHRVASRSVVDLSKLPAEMAGRGFDTEQNRPTNLQIPLVRK
jgi:hypothetical protein